MNDPRLRVFVPAIVFAIAVLLVLPAAAHAQVKVIISGGFATAYQEVLPEFERTTGIKITTGSGPSQGSGPNTIGGQLRRGVPTDVVILNRKGLDALIAEGLIAAETDVDLAQTVLGVSVRTGAPKPDISAVDAFKRTLLAAKTIAMPGSTSGIYLTDELFPRLGIDKQVEVKVATRATEAAAMVARGEAGLVIQPVSELLHAPGIDFVGTIPAEIQHVSVFSAAVVANSKEQEAAKRLIAFLASEKTVAAIKKSGMEPK
ncbi:MAG: extracellular solute-binding protein [Candidatus Korobacteraceae bacterium]